jgi:homoserine O-acetyltransferase
VHDDLEHSIGPGRLLDTREYTVVVPNLLGNGVSYSPSRDVPYFPPSAGVPYVPPWYVPRLPPPTFVSIADNVAAQHALLRHLGLKCDASQPLALIYGYSMGALQAYEWAVRAPDGVERIAAVCGAARCGELNRIFLRSLAAALQADAAWDPLLCRFTRRPARGLEAFASVYAGWGVGERFYVDKAYEAAGYASADVFLEVSE